MMDSLICSFYPSSFYFPSIPIYQTIRKQIRIIDDEMRKCSTQKRIFLILFPNFSDLLPRPIT